MSEAKSRTILIMQEVPASRCFGDIDSGVRPWSPYTPENISEYKDDELSPLIKKAVGLGLHVYVTESDAFMFYAPDNINTQAQAIIEFLS